MHFTSCRKLRSLSLVTALIVGLAVARSASPASAAAVLTATPNPVVIPAGETAGVFELTWDSGTGQDVELVLQRSGKPPDPPLLVASAGTMKDVAISVAEVVTVTMQEPGGARPLTRPLTVTGVQGEQPSVPDCSQTVCVFETAEQPHGTWATITTYFAEIDEAYVDVRAKGSSQVDTVAYQLPQYAGPGVAVLNGLTAGTLYEYWIYVVDYFGNKVEETSGVFETLTRHVTLEFGTIEILDDSDDGGSGEFFFSFNLANSGWNVFYPSSGVVEWGTGMVASFGVVLDATGVGTSIPFGFFVDEDDSDFLDGLCTQGLTVGSTGTNDCHSWITITDTIDASITGNQESFVTGGTLEGSNYDNVDVRVHWTATVDYV